MVAHRDEWRVSNSGQAVWIVLSGLRGAIDHAVAHHPEYLKGREFIEERVEMAEHYLLK
ncbi:MAG: hypothetical protein GY910_27820 [bacterium]|nr:hypothetical protein [bacterium]